MKSTGRRALFLLPMLLASAAGFLRAQNTLTTAELYRGVSLEDLAASHEEEVSPSLDRVASVARAYVASQRDLALHKVLSVSLHEFNREAGTITVDILGRDRAFAVVDRDGLGGLGFIRAEVQFAASPSEVRATGHKIVLQRDWVDLDPRVRVSLADRVAVVEDEGTGFRRNFPLGVGAIDAVHFRGVTTVMTPTTELAVLDKVQSWRRRGKPRYYKNRPFLPLNVPVAVVEPGKPVHYRESAIAFHIWQAPKFRRGFLSHGCMRMRDADLDEMAAFVFGVKGTIPVTVRIEAVEGARHPEPYMNDEYNAVQNFGTADHPHARKMPDEEGVALTKLHRVAGEPPSADSLTGMTLDPAYGPVPGGMMESSAAHQIRDLED